MNKNFKLSGKLKLFVQVATGYKAFTLGYKFPVSIRRRYSFSQSIVIYPESGYSYFTSNEVMCFVSLAKGLELDSFVQTENGVPVIEITDYSLKEK